MPCVALAAGALIAIPLAVNAQSYRCVGKDGKKYYGQTIPNQCIGQAVEQLDKQGMVVRRIENQSAEDKAIKKAEEKKKSEEAAIKRALDLGAEGIIVPQVNTAQQAADIVRYARYAPAGRDSRQQIASIT
jgi:alpha-D-ribose 1-methylphosphonate 5-triphosphate synthase subunit PhnI